MTAAEQNFENLKWLLEGTVCRTLREILLIFFDDNIEVFYEKITRSFNSQTETSNIISCVERKEIEKGMLKKSQKVLKIEVLCKIFRLDIFPDKHLPLIQNGGKDRIKLIEEIWNEDIIGNNDVEEIEDEKYKRRCDELLEISNWLCDEHNPRLDEIGNQLKVAINRIHSTKKQGDNQNYIVPSGQSGEDDSSQEMHAQVYFVEDELSENDPEGATATPQPTPRSEEQSVTQLFNTQIGHDNRMESTATGCNKPIQQCITQLGSNNKIHVKIYAHEDFKLQLQSSRQTNTLGNETEERMTLTLVCHSKDAAIPMTELVETSESAKETVNQHLKEENIDITISKYEKKCLLVSFTMKNRYNPAAFEDVQRLCTHLLQTERSDKLLTEKDKNEIHIAAYLYRESTFKEHTSHFDAFAFGHFTLRKKDAIYDIQLYASKALNESMDQKHLRLSFIPYIYDSDNFSLQGFLENVHRDVTSIEEQIKMALLPYKQNLTLKEICRNNVLDFYVEIGEHAKVKDLGNKEGAIACIMNVLVDRYLMNNNVRLARFDVLLQLGTHWCRKSPDLPKGGITVSLDRAGNLLRDENATKNFIKTLMKTGLNTTELKDQNLQIEAYLHTVTACSDVTQNKMDEASDSIYKANDPNYETHIHDQDINAHDEEVIYRQMMERGMSEDNGGPLNSSSGSLLLSISRISSDFNKSCSDVTQNKMNEASDSIYKANDPNCETHIHDQDINAHDEEVIYRQMMERGMSEDNGGPLNSSSGSLLLSISRISSDFNKCDGCEVLRKSCHSMASLSLWDAVEKGCTSHDYFLKCHRKFWTKFKEALERTCTSITRDLRDKNLYVLLKRLFQVEKKGQVEEIELTNVVYAIRFFGPLVNNKGESPLVQHVHEIVTKSIMKTSKGKISWFAGLMSREDAECRLQGQQNFTYLIRMSTSESDSGSFVISVMKDYVRHFVVQGDPKAASESDPFSCHLEFDGKIFRYITDVADYLREEPIKDPESKDGNDTIWCRFICPGLPLNSAIVTFKKV